VESAQETIRVTGSLSGERIRVRERLDAHLGAPHATAVCSIVNYLVVGWVGGLATAVAGVLGIEAFKRVREKEGERF
jgi:NAD-dependent DNA ligase